jgi:hypothetical protein
MLSAAFTVVVIILEYLGVFRDFGIVLGALGVIATVIFGISASTRSSVRALDYRLVGVDDRLGTIDHRLGSIDNRLGAIDNRLGSIDNRLGTIDNRLGTIDNQLGTIDTRLERIDDRLGGVQQRLDGFVEGQRATNEALIRIEELLRARLPAA